MARATESGGDGDGDVESTIAAEQRFLQWLADNGASFPKLQWPTTTPNGMRGVTATECISTDERMLCIPRRLLITEELCWNDPQLGPVLRDNQDVFSRDDPVLALFLVREMVRGEHSFFYPYLSILPYPESIQDWTEAERHELQDRRLEEAAARRSAEIDVYFRRVFTRLDEKYPGEFPTSVYTLDKFSFAWKTIQARTFGRRLPWTALVPFADCLNHTNVATKYDFDVGGNGLFRLFPSASTSFAAGAEVFNSYGRRSSFQLLLDYGFALPDNEWDYVDVELAEDRAGPRGRKLRFMRRVVRIDRQRSLDELFPPAFLTALADPTPKEEDDPAAVAISELLALNAALEWLRELLVETLRDWERLARPEEDERLLRERETPHRLRTAITYRTSRRRIVEGVIGQIDGKLKASEEEVSQSVQSADAGHVASVLDGLNLQ